ncbi:MAG: hypothetical protein ACTSX6_07645 [Candidatus Heimdallarchaeaceae archaeon]
MFQKYISNVVESCQKDQSYVVMLKWDSIDVVHEKIKTKCDLKLKIGNVIEKYEFNNSQISFYKTGKLMLKNVENVEKFLNELLK